MNEKPVHPTTITTKILMFLARQYGNWATWGPSMYMPSVQGVFRVGTKEEAQLRFMQKLQRADLVGGCDCGCRGDYTLTPKGLDFLSNDCLTGEQEWENWKKAKFPFGY